MVTDLFNSLKEAATGVFSQNIAIYSSKPLFCSILLLFILRQYFKLEVQFDAVLSILVTTKELNQRLICDYTDQTKDYDKRTEASAQHMDYQAKNKPFHVLEAGKMGTSNLRGVNCHGQTMHRQNKLPGWSEQSKKLL